MKNENELNKFRTPLWKCILDVHQKHLQIIHPEKELINYPQIKTEVTLQLQYVPK